MDKITQAELIAKVSEKTNQSKAATKATIEAAAEAIKGYAKNGQAVPFPGLGTFKPTDRAARTGRNPITGAEIEIQAKRVLTFKQSSAVDLGQKVQTFGCKV